MGTNGSRTIEGQDYEISYAPTIDGESLRLFIAISSEEKKKLAFIDASNSFQTNVTFNPEDRQYISTPILHLEWFRFRFRFLKHDIAKHTNHKELVMQTMRNIQGTKDSGYEWY